MLAHAALTPMTRPLLSVGVCSLTKQNQGVHRVAGRPARGPRAQPPGARADSGRRAPGAKGADVLCVAAQVSVVCHTCVLACCCCCCEGADGADSRGVCGASQQRQDDVHQTACPPRKKTLLLLCCKCPDTTAPLHHMHIQTCPAGAAWTCTTCTPPPQHEDEDRPRRQGRCPDVRRPAIHEDHSFESEAPTLHC